MKESKEDYFILKTLISHLKPIRITVPLTGHRRMAETLTFYS